MARTVSVLSGRNPSFNGTYSPTQKNQNYENDKISRNPSFNGTYSPTTKQWHEQYQYYQVAILLLMELTLQPVNTARSSETGSRNPSFNGTYSPTSACVAFNILCPRRNPSFNETYSPTPARER